ncbi:MAG TPA: hypothetical protein DDW50_00635 [Firmicutes bacterium]|jgi:hypothetical protein|nr:hypothetical protein [Bacillota bacterium]
MKKRTGFQIFIIFLIGLMLLLSCHPLLHHPLLDDADDQCLLCHILYTGFTCSFSFELILLLIFIEIVVLLLKNTVQCHPQTGYYNRAPPIAFLFY